ncbi:hypothetical protein [Longirhabdus pacifica]|uniref:hypothetical protein n=1 Tax=Longirhabdus pacifica TaxID=2305227 RepID=UPI001008BDA5|nr:hypothetical protein [Longirhabdus pacifica]
MTWSLLSHIGLWVFMILQFAFMIWLAKTIFEFLNRFRVTALKVEEIALRVNQEAPLFRAKDQHDDIIKLMDHPTDRTMIIFSKRTCSTCQEVLAKIPDIRQQLDDRIIIMTDELYDKDEMHQLPNVHYIYSEEIREIYFITKVPTIIGVDKESGKINYIVDNYTLDDQVNELKEQYGKAS